MIGKELKIGHRYNSRGIIYEVREATEGCGGCSFYNLRRGWECTDERTPDGKYRMGPCTCNIRTDHKDVNFVQVGEGEPDPQGRVVEVT